MTNEQTPAIHPERQARVAKSLRFYSVAAVVTGIWLLILVVEICLLYTSPSPRDS